MKKPFKIVAVLGYLGQSAKRNVQQQHKFFQRLRTRRIQYLRVFTVCPWGKQTPSSQPYDRLPDGTYDLLEFNTAFFTKLKELADLAGDFGVALIIDLFDHCGTNKTLRKNNPWYNNINGVRGFYDTSRNSMMHQQRLIKKIIDTIGFHAYRKTALGIVTKVRPHIYSLGNELYTQRGTGQDYHWIGRYWALPHALHLRKLGYKGKIFFSAHPWAAHAIWGYLSPEGSWCGSTFKIRDLVQQLHGMSYPVWVEDYVRPFVHGRYIGVSDDGTNIRYDEDKGICINGNRYCSADKDLVCSTLKTVKNVCDESRGHQRKLHSIEQLPRSVSESYQTLKNLNQHRDVNVWMAVGRRVYGQDWTRRTPRYLRKRYDLKGQ